MSDSSEEMNNEKQENERLQRELRQIVDKYSILLQKLLERCDELVKERDQLQKERDELVKERDEIVKERDEIVKENRRFHEKECSKKQTSYQCSPAMATCDGLSPVNHIL
jgi:peptidoglycan hydrolase CwlO-like protein